MRHMAVASDTGEATMSAGVHTPGELLEAERRLCWCAALVFVVVSVSALLLLLLQ